MPKKQIIKLTQDNMRIEFISGGGHFPEISIIHDLGTTRYIGKISTMEDLKKLREALQDIPLNK